MLEKPEKEIGSKLALENFFWHFQLLAVFANTCGPWGQPAPKTGQKAQRRPKKLVLGITLARQNVFTWLFGFKSHFWGRPTVLEGLETPTERSGPPLGPPPARPGPGPKIFSVGGPGGPEKKFFPKNFLFKKRYSSGWFLGPKNSFWAPLDPPKGAILAHFTHKMAKMGFKKRPKKRIFEKTFFALNHFISVPTWSGTLNNPKLAS